LYPTGDVPSSSGDRSDHTNPAPAAEEEQGATGFYAETGVHQLRLIVYPSICTVFQTSQVVGLGICEPSTKNPQNFLNMKLSYIDDS